MGAEETTNATDGGAGEQEQRLVNAPF